MKRISVGGVAELLVLSGRAVAPGRDAYGEAQARYLDSSKRFVGGARTPTSTAEAPEPAP